MAQKKPKSNHFLDGRNWKEMVEKFGEFVMLFSEDNGLSPAEMEILLYVIINSHRVVDMMHATGLKPVEPRGPASYII